MEPTRPRTYVLSGVAPTIRARSALVRAMSALNRWEDAYLAGRVNARTDAYLELRHNVEVAKAAMAEATGAAGPDDDPIGFTEAEARALDGNR